MHFRSLFTQSSDFSPRSRVRGHLELYHAFLHDTILPIAAPEEVPVDERDWEIVGEAREESPADVS